MGCLVAVLIMAGCGGGGGSDEGDAGSPTGVASTPTLAAPSVTPTPNAGAGVAVGALRFEADGGVSVLRSEGAAWRREFSAETFGPLGLRLAFSDRQNGWIVDRPSGQMSHIFHTTNGGTSWEDQTPNIEIPSGFAELQDIVFESALQGVAVGARFADVPDALSARPIVLVTQDGGAHWLPAALTLQPERPASLTSVCLTPLGNGVAVGTSGTSGEMILRTSDAGATWLDITDQVRLSQVEFSDLSTVSCVDPGSFWIGGTATPSGLLQPTVLHSGDGGQTWVNRSPASSPATDQLRIEIEFVDANRGWAILEGSSVILHTDDAGRSWRVQPISDQSSASFAAIDFRDSESGVVVGSVTDGAAGPPRALIVTTQDGGASWNQSTIETADVIGLDDVSAIP